VVASDVVYGVYLSDRYSSSELRCLPVNTVMNQRSNDDDIQEQDTQDDQETTTANTTTTTTDNASCVTADDIKNDAAAVKVYNDSFYLVIVYCHRLKYSGFGYVIVSTSRWCR